MTIIRTKLATNFVFKLLVHLTMVPTSHSSIVIINRLNWLSNQVVCGGGKEINSRHTSSNRCRS